MKGMDSNMERQGVNMKTISAGRGQYANSPFLKNMYRYTNTDVGIESRSNVRPFENSKKNVRPLFFYMISSLDQLLFVNLVITILPVC